MKVTEQSHPAYIPRLIDDRLKELLSALPAVLVIGPRASGKTTTASRHVSSLVRLDRPAEALAFEADPDAAPRLQTPPVLLDEWQAVPGVLGAIKRAVDEDSAPGRFLLTGSVRAELEGATWPGTGRIVRLCMYSLTVKEMMERTDTVGFLDRVATADLRAFPVAQGRLDLVDYVQLALRGGYPEPALHLSDWAREVWLEGYLDQLFTRDARSLDAPRDPDRLRRYFEAVAVNTAGVVEHKTIYDAAGITYATALAYDRLLTNLFIVENLPAWSTNRLSRLARTPKRYVVDPSLVGAVLRLSVNSVLRDGNLLGRLIDTFVMAQIRPEVALSASRPRLYHLRNRDGRREIDLLAEMAAGEIVALEITATSAPSVNDARHLAWLRDELGDRFAGGAVLHTGPIPFQLGDRILALPICTLWS